MAKRRDADEDSKASRFVWEEGDVQIVSRGPKYPDITLRLVGEDGNAFAILGRVIAAMERVRVPDEEIETFRAEATSGDYYALLATVLRWISAD